MANTILHKRSATPAGVPTAGQLSLGELAVNTYDGKLYMKKNDGVDAIVEVGAGIANVQADLTPALGGDLTLNGHSIVTADGIAPNAITLTVGTDTDGGTGPNLDITGSDSLVAGGVGGPVNITAGAGALTGGNITLTPGAGTTAGVVQLGGDLDVGGFDIVTSAVTTGVNATPLYINGGANSYAGGGYLGAPIELNAGSGTNGNYGGYVGIYAGNSDTAGGGYVNIYGGSSTSEYGGWMNLVGGSAGGTANGGYVNINGGAASDSGAGGYINIEAGGSSTGTGGDVRIAAGANGGRVRLLKGGTTGDISVETNTGSAGVGEIKIWRHTNTAHTTGNYVSLKAGATLAADVTLTLPEAVGGAGDVLTDVAGDGVMSWTTPDSGAAIASLMTLADREARPITDMGSDIDSITTKTGLYIIASASNLPFGITDGALLHLAEDSTTHFQMLFDYATGAIYNRRYWFSGSLQWSPWLKQGQSAIDINAQTGTTYTLAATDAGSLVTLSNAAAITLTIPTNATTPFPIGTQIIMDQEGAGQVTVSGAGVTIHSAGSLVSTAAQYSTITLVKKATDTWLLAGDLA